MFFLKELPTRHMIEGFLQTHPGADITNIESALLMMRRASTLVRRLERYFAMHDLSQLRYIILIVIAREPDRDTLKIHEILDRIDVSKPVMTRTLNSLHADGLIALSNDPLDKRTKLVGLTPKGEDKLGAVLPGYFEILNTFMEQTDHAPD